MKKIKLIVTDELLDEAERDCKATDYMYVAKNCAIAKAVYDATGGTKVAVSPGFISDFADSKLVQLPCEISRYVIRFDEWIYGTADKPSPALFDLAVLDNWVIK